MSSVNRALEAISQRNPEAYNESFVGLPKVLQTNQLAIAALIHLEQHLRSIVNTSEHMLLNH